MSEINPLLPHLLWVVVFHFSNSNTIKIVGYSHKCWATIALAYFEAGQNIGQRFRGGVGVYVPLLVACRVPSCTNDTRMGVDVLLYISTSPCLIV